MHRATNQVFFKALLVLHMLPFPTGDFAVTQSLIEFVPINLFKGIDYASSQFW